MLHFKRIVIALYVVLLFFPLVLTSQTYNGAGADIPDNGTSIDFLIHVSGLVPANIQTTGFGLESVCINLTHTWDSDLDIRLIAPDGTSVVLTSGNGDSGDDYAITCFNGNASNSIISGTPPFNGTYRPQGTLGLVNNGQNANGVWILRILDTYAWADEGTLFNWSITFGNNPSSVYSPASFNIPLVVINTYGQTIPDDNKIEAHMGIIDNGSGNLNHMGDPFNAYDGYIGIELRGSSSQMFPKKSYALETRDSLGNNFNVQLLGMPKENDWALIANYSDKTMMRNTFTYDMFRKMGHWAPRTRYCEVVINNEYMGVYGLMEKIKRDDDRVDIAALLPQHISGDSMTGGYIIKIDKWTGSNNDGWQSAYPPMSVSQNQHIEFIYHYPEADDIVAAQKSYIQAFMFAFESTLMGSQFNDPLNGYYQYVNLGSFVDFFIMNEISKNTDGYRLSTYMFKDRDSNGGKLTMGPVWDFDLAYYNANYCGGDNYTGWAYNFGNVCPDDWWQVPFWWDRLLQDSIFTSGLKCRWEELRGNELDTTNIFGYLDSVAIYLDSALIRNFYQWPILGVYVWPNTFPLPQTYAEEIENLKKWFRNRLDWLDENIPGYCSGVFVEKQELHPVTIFPNPADDVIWIKADYTYNNAIFELYDLRGNIVLKTVFNYLPIDVSDIASGIYIWKLMSANEVYTGKITVM